MTVTLFALRKTRKSRDEIPSGAAVPLGSGSGFGGPVNPKRRRLFRLVALLLLPVALLVAAEGILRLARYGYPTSFYVPRPTGKPAVWIDNQDFGRRFFPPGLVRYPRPTVFADQRPPGGLRIFVLGESAAMGDPDPKFGLPRMLETLLQARFPRRHVEVLNAAMVAINSHVLLPIATDCARRQGDLWVIYTGNNEAIGPFGSVTVFGSQAPPLPFIRASAALKTWRLGQFMDDALRWLPGSAEAPSEWGGMAMMADQTIRFDAPSSARLDACFRSNLEAILDRARDAGVRVVLCSVAANLKDCPPFASLHRPDVTPRALGQWEAAYNEGAGLEARGDCQEALKSYQRAAAIDPHFAELSFRQARCLQSLGRPAEAASHYRDARDHDALPARATGRLNNIIRDFARARTADGVRFVDAEALFATNSPQGLIGSEHFYEHVHLKPSATFLLAEAVANDVVQALGLAANGANTQPIGHAGANTSSPAASAGPIAWLSESECLSRLGFTDWNRRDLLSHVVARMELPPYTRQLGHEDRLRALRVELEQLRFTTKPAYLERAARQVAQTAAAHPDDADVRWNLAQLWDMAGKAAEAEAEWREVIGLRSHSVLARCNLARNYSSRGRAADAAALYRDCLKMTPGDYTAQYELGVVLAKQGGVDGAIAHLRRAVRLKPRAVEARLALGLALAQAKKPAEAAVHFREVLRLDPGNTTARAQLGESGSTR